jgi:hypothetical protein
VVSTTHIWLSALPLEIASASGTGRKLLSSFCRAHSAPKSISVNTEGLRGVSPEWGIVTEIGHCIGGYDIFLLRSKFEVQLQGSSARTKLIGSCWFSSHVLAERRACWILPMYCLNNVLVSSIYTNLEGSIQIFIISVKSLRTWKRFQPSSLFNVLNPFFKRYKVLPSSVERRLRDAN